MQEMFRRKRRLPFHLALAGKASRGHLQTDPVGLFQRGAFLIVEPGSPSFLAGICLKAGTSSSIHINARQERFQCAGAHASTPSVTERLARPRVSAFRARSICDSKQVIEG